MNVHSFIKRRFDVSRKKSYFEYKVNYFNHNYLKIKNIICKNKKWRFFRIKKVGLPRRECKNMNDDSLGTFFSAPNGDGALSDRGFCGGRKWELAPSDLDSDGRRELTPSAGARPMTSSPMSAKTTGAPPLPTPSP